MAARRSSRRRFDDDGWEPPTRPDTRTTCADVSDDGDTVDEPTWSSYRDAAHGPSPTPDWVVTDPRAVDTDLGVLKTGKEADVSLLVRRLDVPGEAPAECRLAVKRYRNTEHRMFHRDAGYLEGRRVRDSREMRAMATRTEFGRELIAGQWAAAEFAVLSRLWRAGAAVPYPVQLLGTELMLELVGDADGTAAPRLAQLRPDERTGRDLYHQLVVVLRQLADAGYAHADLSAYNVLVHDGRLVLIDLPQAVDLVGNPQGFDFLRRDCVNICTWFAAHGVADADAHELYADLAGLVPRA